MLTFSNLWPIITIVILVGAVYLAFAKDLVSFKGFGRSTVEFRSDTRNEHFTFSRRTKSLAALFLWLMLYWMYKSAT